MEPAMHAKTFSYRETHGIARAPGNLVHRSSEGLGWSHMYASVQAEGPCEAFFPAVDDHLIAVPLDHGGNVVWRTGKVVVKHVVHPGCVSIVPGGTDLDIQTYAATHKVETVHVYIRKGLLEKTCADLYGYRHGCALDISIGVGDRLIQAIVMEIRGMLLGTDRSDRLYADTLSHTLACHLVRRYTRGVKLHREAMPALSPDSLGRAIEYIHTFLEDRLDLNSIAHAAGLNPRQLARQFKKSMNVTPYEFVTRLRVDRAKQLLSETDLPLADVALQCGFSHQQHMTSMVHRLVGLTPGAIRRSGRSN
jgi:AraC family transcriptional regulator